MQENEHDKAAVEHIANAKLYAKRLVCNLAQDNQYIVADCVWHSLRMLHRGSGGAEGGQFQVHISELEEQARVMACLANAEDPYPFTEKEEHIIANNFDVVALTSQQEEWEGEGFTKQQIEQTKEKTQKKEQFNKFEQSEEALLPDRASDLTEMTQELIEAAGHLHKSKRDRDKLCMGALKQHYEEVETCIEETGVQALTVLQMAQPGKDEPWFLGRQATQEVIDACQRMALQELRLRHRVETRETALKEYAPVPPPWYLATEGEYFTGTWREEDLSCTKYRM